MNQPVKLRESINKTKKHFKNQDKSKYRKKRSWGCHLQNSKKGTGHKNIESF